jgi:hypothetical protein
LTDLLIVEGLRVHELPIRDATVEVRVPYIPPIPAVPFEPLEPPR